MPTKPTSFPDKTQHDVSYKTNLPSKKITELNYIFKIINYLSKHI